MWFFTAYAGTTKCSRPNGSPKDKRNARSKSNKIKKYNLTVADKN